MQNWDEQYASGMWDYLAAAPEATRYAIIASYLDRFCSGGAVLDVGCGEGQLHRHINPARYQYTGLDVSHVAIQRAGQRYPASTWLAADAGQFPQSTPARFHAIVFNEFLYYMPDVTGVVSSYAQLLTGPSLIVVSTFLPPDQQIEWVKRVEDVWQSLASFPWTVLDDCLLVNGLTGIRWRIAALTSASPPLS